MPSRTQLVQDIINIEWDMFSNVHNTGGKASCQNDKDDFVIMRKSQFSIWGDDTLASYLADLVKAQQDRRNLMSEKYGFMMEFSMWSGRKNWTADTLCSALLGVLPVLQETGWACPLSKPTCVPNSRPTLPPL